MKLRSSGGYAVAAALILAIGIPSAAVGFGEGRVMHIGKRNPDRQSLNRETKIISSNSTYSTRQSNLTNGDGGGAIYGCRADYNREPCVRASNLKGGRAFEFETVGREAGRMQVGDPAHAPFSTNATGTVENLSADKVDGRDSADFAEASGLLFARVSADGTLAAGSRGATAVSRSAAGNTYTVTFNRDVSACSFTANVTGASSGFGIGALPVAGQPTQVAFDQDDAAGEGGNGRPFHAQVIC